MDIRTIVLDQPISPILIQSLGYVCQHGRNKCDLCKDQWLVVLRRW